MQVRWARVWGWRKNTQAKGTSMCKDQEKMGAGCLGRPRVWGMKGLGLERGEPWAGVRVEDLAHHTKEGGFHYEDREAPGELPGHIWVREWWLQPAAARILGMGVSFTPEAET